MVEFEQACADLDIALFLLPQKRLNIILTPLELLKLN